MRFKTPRMHSSIVCPEREASVSERAVCERMVVGKLRPNRDFDPLNCVHDEQPELAVENVLLPDHAELRAWQERVVGKLAVVPVAAHPSSNAAPSCHVVDDCATLARIL